MSRYSFSSTDFTSALLGLLPRGRAWPKELSSVHAQAVSCFAPTFQRSCDAALNLLIDTFPATTVNFLAEWESTLGLPDPCSGISPTVQGRRNQVVARFSNTGGQSIQFFTSFALGLGYTVSITQYAPFRCGQSACGQQLGGEDWFFTWAINSQVNTVTYFRTGQSAMGDPLASWGNAVLECEMSSAKPAHTILQFHYS
ncbi:YmfQ family protein [Pseudomonas bohemica]|uniref:YmfQ family protein n=1 Tax=Pseudomonas bohemica TaxID=2044872 RepID=UPI000DA621D7|nr:putative phage tail protein [Pseudomonas bohemica]